MSDGKPKPHYRSLVPGGYFSDDPPRDGHLKPGHTARASNNPGAINAGHAWIEQFPGYVYKCETTHGNFTAIFEAPEYGIACWWKLLERYKRGLPTFSLHNIIYTYCGEGREKEAKDYLHYVTTRLKLDENYVVDLSTDTPLISIARAFFLDRSVASAGSMKPGITLSGCAPGMVRTRNRVCERFSISIVSGSPLGHARKQT